MRIVGVSRPQYDPLGRNHNHDFLNHVFRISPSVIPRLGLKTYKLYDNKKAQIAVDFA